MTTELVTDPILRDVPTIDGYKVLDPVLLLQKIGGGGMGSVYRGNHLKLEIDVAVKVLDSALASREGDFVSRFQREARIAASINHQNLIHVYDVAQSFGVHYLVMELVEGESISRRVRRAGPMSETEALRIFRDAARGLAAAHKKGVIHRDIKPDNIMIARDGDVKVADLGLAKGLDGHDEGMTSTRVTLGTPQYMPPEHWESMQSVTPASDVYALGATLWFMLAGKDAIQGNGLAEVMRKVCTEAFPDIRSERSDLSDEVIALLRRCTAAEPERRPRDAGQLVAEIESTFKFSESGPLTASEMSELPTLAVPMPSKITIERARTMIAKKPGPARPERTPTKNKSFVHVRTREKRLTGAVLAASCILAFAMAGVVWSIANDTDSGPSKSEIPQKHTVGESSAEVGSAEATSENEPVSQEPPTKETSPEVEPESKATVVIKNPAPPVDDGESGKIEKTSDEVADSAAKSETEATAKPPSPERPLLPEPIDSPRDGMRYRAVRDVDGRVFFIAECEATSGAVLAFLATLPQDGPDTAEDRPPEGGPEEDREGPPGPHPGFPPPGGRPPRPGDRLPPHPERRRPLEKQQQQSTAPRRPLAARAERLISRDAEALLRRTEAREPAINLSFPAIRAYARWVEDGLRDAGHVGIVRLPRLSEWRQAAGRADRPSAIYPSSAAFPDGQNVASGESKNSGNWNGRRMRPVKSYAAAPNGLFDMLGNAAEICDEGVDQGLFLIGGSFWTTDKKELALDHAGALRPPVPASAAAGFRLVYWPQP
jgi:serine/threonine protein kinase/formylglycine-generating enzyme required for sulfatase activity